MSNQDLRGEGLLIVDGESYPARYRLQIVTRGGMKDGGGVVGNEGGGTSAAFGGKKAILQLADGRTAPIIVTRWSPIDEYSDFKLAGALS